jgi:O-antigen/teichoic acid export membrane protein
LQVSRLVVAIMLARLLAPHQFGLAAMVLIF